ncbi:MAG: hypothetical protein FJ086_03440 [Deltaproteobacteria bacterium]|nr:hypothetical protein [Deltaproteobacteria bacterium]
MGARRSSAAEEAVSAEPVIIHRLMHQPQQDRPGPGRPPKSAPDKQLEALGQSVKTKRGTTLQLEGSFIKNWEILVVEGEWPGAREALGAGREEKQAGLRLRLSAVQFEAPCERLAEKSFLVEVLEAGEGQGDEDWLDRSMDLVDQLANHSRFDERATDLAEHIGLRAAEARFKLPKLYRRRDEEDERRKTRLTREKAALLLPLVRVEDREDEVPEELENLKDNLTVLREFCHSLAEQGESRR